ncbi:ribonucleoside transporter [Enterobacter cancerogenus]|uniref:Ribonucleoside transporter n=1 Tax=Enterobacter cancerogenus TaxID=69218 RepID=A0A484WWL0_9ENTR|nr:ribonucleoside transporter [Enterobacter cancerogenus]
MTMAGFDVDGLTLVLLSFGIASFVGTSLSSQFLKRSLKVALAGAPLVLAISAAVLLLWGSDKWVASAIAIIWGFAFALVPVGWSTWITRSLADQAEKAGSIQVAVIQLANTCGAAVGGVALDHLGLTSPLVIFRHADAADGAAGGSEGEGEFVNSPPLPGPFPKGARARVREYQAEV